MSGYERATRQQLVELKRWRKTLTCMMERLNKRAVQQEGDEKLAEAALANILRLAQTHIKTVDMEQALMQRLGTQGKAQEKPPKRLSDEDWKILEAALEKRRRSLALAEAGEFVAGVDDGEHVEGEAAIGKSD